MLSAVLDALLTILEGAAVLPSRRDGTQRAGPTRTRVVVVVAIAVAVLAAIGGAIWLAVRAVGG